LEMTVYKPDPDASAVILSDRGVAKLVLGSSGFQIEFDRSIKIKIINSRGFEYANFSINCLTGDNLQRIKASAYNLVNDSIVVTTVNPKEFIRDKSSKYTRSTRIAYPNVSEGTIIECQYRLITKSIYSFVPWKFQSEIPTHYSEFTAVNNAFFNYNAIVKGDGGSIKRDYKSVDVNIAGYSTTESINMWYGNVIPAFKSEPYITGREDLLTKLNFELVGTNFPNSAYNTITPTYKDLPKKLLERSDFGVPLNSSSFLAKQSKIIADTCNNEADKLREIHSYVSNKILWNGDFSFSTDESLRKVYTKERGNSAEVNLILIAMLRHAGLKANPVIISTRGNGAPHPFLAMITAFDHVIASVSIDGKQVLVDATEPLLPYDQLPYYCLNDYGRLVDEKNPIAVKIYNKERYINANRVKIDIDNNGTITGTIQNTYGGYSAYAVRKFVNLESIKGYNDYIAANQPNWLITNLKLDNIDNLNNYVIETYDFAIEKGAQKTSAGLILNPNLFVSDEANQFNSEERKFPIDFGCPRQSTYSLSLSIPSGYMVEEFPSSISISLPEKGGSYKLICTNTGNTIIIESLLKIEQVFFKATDYNILREFFAQVTRKQAELIVLKKI
jgi:hypothetical protein